MLVAMVVVMQLFLVGDTVVSGDRDGDRGRDLFR